jgi:hypothetical protein
VTVIVNMDPFVVYFYNQFFHSNFLFQYQYLPLDSVISSLIQNIGKTRIISATDTCRQTMKIIKIQFVTPIPSKCEQGGMFSNDFESLNSTFDAFPNRAKTKNPDTDSCPQRSKSSYFHASHVHSMECSLKCCVLP